MFIQGIERLRLKPAIVQDTDTLEKTYQLAPYLGAFGAHLMPQYPIGFKRCLHIPKQSLERGGQLTLSSICSKSH